MNPESQVPQQPQAASQPPSGQPIGAPQPPPRPPTLPPPPIRPARRPGYPSPIPGSFLAICLAGVFLIGIGVIVVTSTSFLIDYEDGYYYEAQYDPNLVNIMSTAGRLVMHIGTMTLAIGLLITGFMTQNIGPNTRMGLFIAAGLIVGLWLGLQVTINPYFP